MTGRRPAPRAAAVTAAVLLAACTATVPQEARSPQADPSPSQAATPGVGPTPEPAPTPPPQATLPPATIAADPRFDEQRAMRDVRALSVGVGPRLATSPAYDRAADRVSRRLTGLGYDVVRQAFPVPAGDSWGVRVAAGRSANVVATPPGFDARRPHLLVGAHLDTVAASPGAEDNASGVAVLLELARLAAMARPRLPTAFVAFGGEEPRGPGDDLHHFGSRHYVAQMGAEERDALRAMVSLDRVGVGAVVPVCTGPLSPPTVAEELAAAARRLDVPIRRCENVASDHWSFEKAGHRVARLGSTPYAGYHSAQDLPEGLSPGQLGQVGRLAWAWLRPAPNR